MKAFPTLPPDLEEMQDVSLNRSRRFPLPKIYSPPPPRCGNESVIFGNAKARVSFFFHLSEKKPLDFSKEPFLPWQRIVNIFPPFSPPRAEASLADIPPSRRRCNPSENAASDGAEIFPLHPFSRRALVLEPTADVSFATPNSRCDRLPPKTVLFLFFFCANFPVPLEKSS